MSDCNKKGISKKLKRLFYEIGMKLLSYSQLFDNSTVTFDVDVF